MTNIKTVPFTLLNAHMHGNAIEQMLRLRYKGFIIEEKYDVRNYDNTFEFDQYDDPSAYYIGMFQGNTMVACSRIRRTDSTYSVTNTRKDGTVANTNITYMAKDVWPDQIEERYLVSSVQHYEVTRLYVDSSLPARERMCIARELFCATYGYVLFLGGTLASSVTHNTLVNSVKKLGMKIVSACSISMPNFHNQQYVSADVNLEDFICMINNLYGNTKTDVVEFAKKHGLTAEEARERITA